MKKLLKRCSSAKVYPVVIYVAHFIKQWPYFNVFAHSVHILISHMTFELFNKNLNSYIERTVLNYSMADGHINLPAMYGLRSNLLTRHSKV